MAAYLRYDTRPHNWLARGTELCLCIYRHLTVSEKV